MLTPQGDDTPLRAPVAGAGNGGWSLGIACEVILGAGEFCWGESFLAKRATLFGAPSLGVRQVVCV